MKRDESLGLAAGFAGGLLIGIAVMSRRKPSLRTMLAHEADRSLSDLTDLATSAARMASRCTAAIVRQQDAIRSAFQSGRKAYLKHAS
jgi:hypothetical protein